MLTTDKTVFILGAGASCPYHYPSSKKLTESIWVSILNNPQRVQLELEKSEIGYTYDVFEKFAKELKESDVDTIDRWLAINDSYKTIGKICIAREIIKCEYKSLEREKNHWYAELWNNYLFEGCDTPEDVSKNQVSFITFNYDRSLEYYLHKMLRYSFAQVEKERIFKALQSFKIIHVHGSVGFLEWQCEPGTVTRPYQNTDDWKIAKDVSSGLKIISETQLETHEYNLASEELKKAQNIIFLGFGYHPENLLRLKFRNSLYSKIYGTAYELNSRDRKRITPLIKKSPVGGAIELGDYNDDIVTFMRKKIIIE
jgi:hypothetical protein